MKYTTPFFIILLNLLFFLNIQSILSADPYGLDDEWSEYNEQGNFNNLNGFVITRATSTINDTIATITDNPLKIQDLLHDSIYHKTHPPMRRPLLDLPVFQYFSDYYNQDNFYIQPFYNHTYKEYFSGQRSTLDYFVDMEQNVLVQKLVENNITVNVPEVLGLFKNLKTQERRMGLMFQRIHKTDTWTWSFRIPLYWTLHNLFLTPEEQDRIEKYPLFVSDLKVDFMPFAKAHLIADRLGLGDLRINAEYTLKDTLKYHFAVGIKATIPTGCPVIKGIYGSEFDSRKPSAKINIKTDLTDLIEDSNFTLAQTKSIDFLLAALDRLSTILIQQKTGNNYHVGIGGFTHTTYYFNDMYSFNSLISFELFMPAVEQRFFKINNQAAFDQFNWANTSSRDTEKLTFLNKQLMRKFFPSGYDATVLPGITLQSTTSFIRKGPRFTASIGSDLWFNSKEHILSVKADLDELLLIDIPNASRGYALQSSVWLGIENTLQEERIWQYGLKIGLGLTSQSIGQDYTVMMHIRKNF